MCKIVFFVCMGYWANNSNLIYMQCICHFLRQMSSESPLVADMDRIQLAFDSLPDKRLVLYLLLF